MRVRSLGSLLAGAGACLALIAAASAAPVSLHYAWRTGQTEQFDMTQVSRSEISAAEGAGKAQTTQTHHSRVQLEVKEVKESGDARVQWMVKQVRMEIRQLIGDPLVLDSQNAEHRKDPNAIPLFAMIDHPIMFTVSATGEVSEVAGVESVLESLKSQYKDHPNADKIIPTLEQGFTNEQMANQIRQTLGVLPPKAVEVGDTWERTYDTEAPMIGTVRTDETVKLVAIRDTDQGRIAEVRGDADLKVVNEAAESVAKLTASSATNELLFDLDEGMLESYIVESSMDLVGTPPGSDKQVTAKISTKTSLKRESMNRPEPAGGADDPKQP